MTLFKLNRNPKVLPLDIQLQVPTPKAWLAKAANSLQELLSDHAECEKKAAITAINFTRYFHEHRDVLDSLALIAREEMRHFDRVLFWLDSYSLSYTPTEACRYAKSLHQYVKQHRDAQIVDKLLVAAVIEARSCERFALLVPWLDSKLGGFYSKLYEAEKRHAQVYINFALKLSSQRKIHSRLSDILAYEADLISAPERTFAFHSGVPSDV